MRAKNIITSAAVAVMMLMTPVFAGDHQLDINAATVEQLQEVKGIGEKTAMAIVAYRNKIGAFTSLDELTHVNGIGEKKLVHIKSFLTVVKPLESESHN
ncbi:helix-hairpin-helix domain-containing protein [Mariprofundus erugo]|uniref:Helix-hairpin-helix domain-containing protein n=1 Tax=Mariprofundus erugo TaxID=2528639 RepID=A0A5R9GYA0_9PROT|nr:helix-hairpin-helix domain-containing protein [Mariprofundus erugo]TLS69053.1 helix-hairpin-helix domain-containing protein [Mariprofundus erugo]